MNRPNIIRLTVSAMLLALSVILGLFKIPISQVSEIRLQFLPVAMGGMLFGPLYGGIIGGLSDILGYIVRPTGPFFPGFTISAIVQGAIYGIMLKKDQSLKMVMIAQGVDCIVVSMILNPVWLYFMYDMGFAALFVTRLIKILVMYPVNVILLMVLIKPCKKYIGEMIQ